MIKEYFRAKSKDDAWIHIQSGAKVIGGGNHVSRNQHKIDNVVDLQELELIKIDKGNGFLNFEPNVTLQKLLENHLVWDSLKKVIVQEFNLNIRNSASIAGAAISGRGRSNLVGWLICSDATYQLYPSSLIVKTEDLWSINYREIGFVDQISIPLKTKINWRMVSRTPDDFPLVSVFIKQNNLQEIIKTVLIGFSEKPIIINEVMDAKNAPVKLGELIEISRSQYTNQFCSLNYYKQTATLLLNRMLVEE